MDLIITGEVGVGKTTACMNLASLLASNGVSLGGILQPSTFREGKKRGSIVLNLSDGSSHSFARLGKHAGFGGKIVGDYVINPDGLRFALDSIAGSEKSEVVFVDEIGTMEFRGKGLMDVVRGVIDSEGHSILVVKKKFLKDFREMFPERDFVVFEVDERNRDNAHREIYNLLQDGVQRKSIRP